MESTKYPRVEHLTYRIVSDERHRYRPDAELHGELPKFRFSIKESAACFVPVERFETEQAAREALEPMLKAWELDAELRHGRGMLRFVFLGAHTMLETPQPGVVNLTGMSALMVTGHVVAVVTHHDYLAPPRDFAVDDLVRDLAEQFCHAKQVPHTLLKNAYAILTRLDYEYGERTEAATSLRISAEALGALQRLSHTRGTGAEIRKFMARVPVTPLTGAEREWIFRVLEAIVRRAGALAAGVDVGERITLASLPLPRGQ